MFKGIYNKALHDLSNTTRMTLQPLDNPQTVKTPTIN